MPRAVRNSWVDIQVDGRKNDIGTGPRPKDGQMVARFYVRSGGRVERSITVEALPRSDGSLILSVYRPEGARIASHTTHRDDDVNEFQLDTPADTLLGLVALAHDKALAELYTARDDAPIDHDRARKLARIEHALNDVRCDLEQL